VAAIVSAGFEARRRELDPLLRRATTHYRRILATQLFAKHLRRYARDRKRYWSVPSRLRTKIRDFAASVYPKTDQMVQTAALVLELAPSLKAAFEGEDRYSVITSYLGLLLLTLDLTQGDKVAAIPIEVLPAGDRPPQSSTEEQCLMAKRRWVLRNRAEVAELAAQFKRARAKVQRRFGMRSSDGKTLESMIIVRSFSPGASFKVEGIDYTLTRIYRKFTYHPEYGTKPPPGQSTAATSYAPPLLLDGDGKRTLTTSPDR
jgi:hypothetical protein